MTLLQLFLARPRELVLRVSLLAPTLPPITPRPSRLRKARSKDDEYHYAASPTCSEAAQLPPDINTGRPGMRRLEWHGLLDDTLFLLPRACAALLRPPFVEFEAVESICR